MSQEHDRLRELLGPYVLGGLDTAERAQIDDHLSTCPTCRDELTSYAGLPALLRLGQGPASSTALEPGDAALARALETVRHERGRRRRLALLASAAAVVLGLGATTAGLMADRADNPEASQAALRLVTASGSNSRGETSLTARPWGTSVDLDVTGLPRGQRFVVWVVSTDGTQQQAATWASTTDGVAHVTGASAIDRTEVAAVRVTTAAGALLLSRDF